MPAADAERYEVARANLGQGKRNGCEKVIGFPCDSACDGSRDRVIGHMNGPNLCLQIEPQNSKMRPGSHAGRSKLERIWRQHLLRHSTSGLSITEFCVQAGVTCSAFFYWKRRLASNGG